MASSRLEKIGTIFTRVTGLLRSGAMKPEDKPIWYDVYAAFPPKLEPRYDRPAPNIPIRKIFYPEDVARAKYQKDVKFHETLNLSDTKYKTTTQQFIEIYNNLQAQGALDDNKIFDTAKELLQERSSNTRLSVNEDEDKEPQPSLVSSFTEAKSSKTVNIKDIFKE